VRTIHASCGAGGAPASTSRSMRSRASSLPRAGCRCRAASDPPAAAAAAAAAVRSRSCCTSACMARAFARYCASPGSTLEARISLMLEAR
jgi:hypothetical protein